MSIRFILSHIFSFFFIFFLLTNAKYPTEGSLVLWAIIFATLIAIIIFVNLLLNYKIYFKRSFFFLLLFFLYFAIRVYFEVGLEQLKAWTVATTGGIIFFYFLGYVSRLSIENIFNFFFKTRFKKIFYFFFIILLFLFIFLLTDILFSYSQNLRSDYFLISRRDGNYQRPGDFITICFIYILILLQFYCLYQNSQKRIFFFTNAIKLIIYSLLCIGIIIAQMLGSNKTFALLISFFFLTLSIDLLTSFKFYKNYFSSILIKNVIKSKIFYISTGFLFVGFVILIVMIIIGFHISNIDTSQFRIAGFGEGILSVIESRSAFREFFWQRFLQAPFFGKLSYDGFYYTHSHSFILTLLSHTGLIGFTIFFIYLYNAFKEFFFTKDKKYINKKNIYLYVYNIKKFYLFYLFLFIFSLAIIGTFITWSPLWFCLGLIFQPLNFKNFNNDILDG